MQKCFFNTVALTALHAAGNDGCVKHVDDPLEAGATVSAGAPDGRTPLSVAHAGGHVEVVQLLSRAFQLQPVPEAVRMFLESTTMADYGKMRRTMVLNLELLEVEIGFDVEGRRVESVAPRSIADGLFFTGDVILAVDGAEVSDDTVVAAMESKLEALLTVLVGWGVGGSETYGLQHSTTPGRSCWQRVSC